MVVCHFVIIDKSLLLANIQLVGWW